MRKLLFILFLGLVFKSQAQNHSRNLGGKSYEISNHLGNVMAVVSDRKLNIADNTSLAIASSETDILSYNDYYPYGMLMDGRNKSKEYRYGFQGQEKDDEVKGKENSVNYKYRVHDVRLGRFFAVDPLSAAYPYYSSYQFSGNKTIAFIELEGLEEKIKTEGETKSRLIGEVNADVIRDKDGKSIEITYDGGLLKEFTVTAKIDKIETLNTITAGSLKVKETLEQITSKGIKVASSLRSKKISLKAIVKNLYNLKTGKGHFNVGDFIPIPGVSYITGEVINNEILNQYSFDFSNMNQANVNRAYNYAKRMASRNSYFDLKNKVDFEMIYINLEVYNKYRVTGKMEASDPSLKEVSSPNFIKRYDFYPSNDTPIGVLINLFDGGVENMKPIIIFRIPKNMYVE